MRTVCGCAVMRLGRDDTQLLFVTEDGKNWGLPKGGVEPGEEFEAAAIRETFEETGIAVKTVGFAGTFGRMSVWFAVPKDPTQPPVPEAGEIMEAKYFSIRSLPNLDERQIPIVDNVVERIRAAYKI